MINDLQFVTDKQKELVLFYLNWEFKILKVEKDYSISMYKDEMLIKVTPEGKVSCGYVD